SGAAQRVSSPARAEAFPGRTTVSGAAVVPAAGRARRPACTRRGHRPRPAAAGDDPRAAAGRGPGSRRTERCRPRPAATPISIALGRPWSCPLPRGPYGRIDRLITEMILRTKGEVTPDL